MKTREYINRLELSELCENFSDYNNGHVSDVVSEIADCAVSVYTQALVDFANENNEWVEEAFADGIAPDSGEFFKNGGDFRGFCAAVGASAWYLANERELYDNIDDCLKMSVCSELESRGYHELGEDHVYIIDGVSANDFETIGQAIDWVVSEFEDIDA